MKIFLSLCLLASNLFPFQKESLPDRVRDEFVGAVKSVRLYRADFIRKNEQWIEGEKKFSHEDGYDKDGYRGSPRERYSYLYLNPPIKMGIISRKH